MKFNAKNDTKTPLFELGIQKDNFQTMDENGNIHTFDGNTGEEIKANPTYRAYKNFLANFENAKDFITHPTNDDKKEAAKWIVSAETLPIGGIGSGAVATKLTPFLGKSVANATAKGLTSGFTSGGVEGYLRGLIDGENPALTAAYDSVLGALTGGVLGTVGGKIARDLNTQEAWHGSPYKFDEFSNDAIGTGEGAQAHGYGHYFAKNKDVADRYRKTLTGDDFDKEQYFYQNKLVEDRDKKAILSIIYENGKEKVIQSINKNLDRWKYDPKEYSKKLKELQWIKSLNEREINRKSAGNLYKVRIPKDNVLLREDATLNNQPIDVKKAIVDYMAKRPNDYIVPTNLNLGGSEARQFLKNDIALNLRRDGIENTKQAISDVLSNQGIKGISYNGGIDGEARVIFNPDDIEIVPNFKDAVKNAYSNVLNDLEKKATPLIRKYKSGNLFNKTNSGVYNDEPMKLYLRKKELSANIDDIKEKFNVNWGDKIKSNWQGTNEKGNRIKSKSRYYPQEYRGQEFEIRVSNHNKALKGSGQWSDDSYTVIDFNGTPVKFNNDFFDGYDINADIVVNKIGDFTKNQKEITKFINNKISETYNKWHKERPDLYK